jgi:hypothetical protein
MVQSLKRLIENTRLESRLQAEARGNRLKAELRTHFDPPPVTFETDVGSAFKSDTARKFFLRTRLNLRS